MISIWISFLANCLCGFSTDLGTGGQDLPGATSTLFHSLFPMAYIIGLRKWQGQTLDRVDIRSYALNYYCLHLERWPAIRGLVCIVVCEQNLFRLKEHSRVRFHSACEMESINSDL